MSAVTTRNVCPYRVSATAEGPDVLVSILTMEGVHYSRALSPEDFGPWWHGFMAAVGDLSSGTVRVRQRDDLIVAFGHWAEDRWFDPRPEHERASDRKAERVASRRAQVHQRVPREACAAGTGPRGRRLVRGRRVRRSAPARVGGSARVNFRADSACAPLVKVHNGDVTSQTVQVDTLTTEEAERNVARALVIDRIARERMTFTSEWSEGRYIEHATDRELASRSRRPVLVISDADPFAESDPFA